MLNIANRREDRWDPVLRRIDDGGHHPESFVAWWERIGSRLSNLDRQIAEQWVYRHWTSTPYRFLTLEDLSWRQETWTSEEVVERVHVESDVEMNPAHDLEVFQGKNRLGPLETARSWRDGSWNIPIVVLSTPTGVLTHSAARPDLRYLLIEGSKRVRYLNALRWNKEETGPHTVFVLEHPEAMRD